VGFGILVSHLGIPKPPPSQLKYIIQTVVKERSLIQLVFLFITGTIIVPIAEEIIFRGYLLNFFKNHTNTVFAVIASAFLFALSHETLLFMPYFIVLGLILAVMYVKTKTIIPCMVTHGLYNLVVMALGVLIYYLKS
jgi:membrane protease YdiL (CAAX protease family)